VQRAERGARRPGCSYGGSQPRRPAACTARPAFAEAAGGRRALPARGSPVCRRAPRARQQPSTPRAALRPADALPPCAPQPPTRRRAPRPSRRSPPSGVRGGRGAPMGAASRGARLHAQLDQPLLRPRGPAAPCPRAAALCAAAPRARGSSQARRAQPCALLMPCLPLRPAAAAAQARAKAKQEERAERGARRPGCSYGAASRG
jgi:hypothetical protein